MKHGEGKRWKQVKEPKRKEGGIGQAFSPIFSCIFLYPCFIRVYPWLLLLHFEQGQRHEEASGSLPRRRFFLVAAVVLAGMWPRPRQCSFAPSPARPGPPRRAGFLRGRPWEGFATPSWPLCRSGSDRDSARSRRWTKPDRSFRSQAGAAQTGRSETSRQHGGK